jgi:surfeit locus 1 family protein
MIKMLQIHFRTTLNPLQHVRPAGKRLVSTAQERIASASKTTVQRGFRSSLLWSFPLVTFGLGTWQVYRLQWKENLIKEIQEGMKKPVLSGYNSDTTSGGTTSNTSSDGTTTASTIRNLPEYHRLTLTGRFLHDKEMHLGPRGRCDTPANSSSAGGVFSSGTSSGFHILTPFQLQDSHDVVIVNRGWVPRDCKHPSQRTDTLSDGPVTMDVIVRKGEQVIPHNTNQSLSLITVISQSLLTLLVSN